MLILVTGATGYIASRLIPRLLAMGHRVRALARDPRRLDGRAWSASTEIFSGDVTDSPSALCAALKGTQAAYYLVHNMSSGRGYTDKETEGARNFAAACAAAGVRHIIYLGGLADPQRQLAAHMRSRIETGNILRAGRVPVTEFRAGIIVGSGSISFEMIRFITELLPIIPGPRHLRNKSQPIAVQNVIDYLLAALDHNEGHGRVFEIGGPDVNDYADLMLRYARLRGLKRHLWLLPHIPVWLMAFGIGLVTPVPSSIAYALVGGLSSDSVILHEDARRVFLEVKLIGFDSAARDALTRLHPDRIERIWTADERIRSLKHEGFFILHRKHAGRSIIPPPSDAAEYYPALQNKWQVEINDPTRVLLYRPRPFGEEWIERRIVGRDSISTYFFAPRGIVGFLYWYLLLPFHIFTFRRPFA
ncbi:MAG: hypothetical protein HFACDABA_02569 [Anaerolineales bacterium]|nr:hypothetical protein [Anaerolineales bacterium]